MKVLCAEYNERGEVAVVPVGDDVLLRNNADFYIPDFTSEVSCVPQLVVRLCRLGKGVSERFASRYYDAVAVGVRFYADTLASELREKGLPEVVASSFENSAAVSGWDGITDCTFCYEMRLNGNVVFAGTAAELPVGIDHLVTMASGFHLLKIGDLLCCGNPFRCRVKAGDRIEMSLGGERKMLFEVK